MLTPEIKEALKGYTANMANTITIVIQTGEHEKREELVDFLADLASISDYIIVEERDAGLRSPLTFILEADGTANGIIFSGIPGGHEFNSLILAILHSSGTELKLDESVKNIVKNVSETLHFEVFISLSCHNCPDVVQALNQFATLNPNISSEMIDGGLYPALIEERNIQGVPSVYLNGEIFANGNMDTAKLIEKLIAREPTIADVTSTEPQLPVQDVLIIGGGPAGISAAIYSARKGLKVTVIADRIGGQVKDTMDIENLISVIKTTGPELSNALLAHMNEYEVTTKEHFRVDKIINDDETKTVHLSSGEIIETRSIIIATGAQWRELGVPGEKENIGNGVAYCPHCDGPFFKGKDIAVIGGGNSGIEAALDLSGIVKSVTVFEFLPDLKADKILIDQIEKRDNITVHTNVATQQIIAADGKVTAIEYQNRETEEVKQLPLAGIFVQIGLLPNNGFLKEVVDLSPYGEVLINERCETNVTGIYACGDVTTVPYKQIVIAMGEGSKAALSAYDYLLKSN
ncbi:MAG: alkyl hydroperoxide reductase subunit F [Methylococcales bacterium]|mgnify:CR=1 FL=1|jgi:alkyl hydroperoxide reductase subunit F|nr:alkyl hydroperoxide reductase subunit F [Methylococcales bacterium]MBT7445755.1 alkyl hydroperoxide reductase subunit F [Methylococcales bacterium]